VLGAIGRGEDVGRECETVSHATLSTRPCSRSIHVGSSAISRISLAQPAGQVIMHAMKTIERRRKTNELDTGKCKVNTRLLDAVGRCLTPAVARRIVELRADAETRARVEELAERCNEGQLTPEERDEYESYVSTSTFIAILQAKARALLARHDRR